jgi:hypothetical protein
VTERSESSCKNSSTFQRTNETWLCRAENGLSGGGSENLPVRSVWRGGAKNRKPVLNCETFYGSFRPQIYMNVKRILATIDLRAELARKKLTPGNSELSKVSLAFFASFRCSKDI